MVGISAVAHHKRDIRIAWIAQNGFQVHDVAVGEVEVIADAYCRVDVDGKMKAAAFADQVAEHEVLKGAVFVLAGNSTGSESLINVLRILTARIAEFG